MPLRFIPLIEMTYANKVSYMFISKFAVSTVYLMVCVSCIYKKHTLIISASFIKEP